MKLSPHTNSSDTWNKSWSILWWCYGVSIESGSVDWNGEFWTFLSKTIAKLYGEFTTEKADREKAWQCLVYRLHYVIGQPMYGKKALNILIMVIREATKISLGRKSIAGTVTAPNICFVTVHPPEIYPRP